LIKFGSRTDVLLAPTAKVQVKVGDRVKGGASVLAYLASQETELVAAGAQAQEGER
jgi:phosphatidylserine decarboxylase